MHYRIPAPELSPAGSEHQPAAPARARRGGIAALQRTVGNNAVLRALAQARFAQRAGGGRPASVVVRRSPGPDMLRSPGRSFVPSVQRMPGDDRPGSRGGGLVDMVRAGFGVLQLREDPVAGQPARRLAVNHIGKVLEDSGQEREETVGKGVMSAIGAIAAVVGEHGARDVHTVFMNSSLTDLYRIPMNDPRAPAAFRSIAEQEPGVLAAPARGEPLYRDEQCGPGGRADPDTAHAVLRQDGALGAEFPRCRRADRQSIRVVRT